MQASVERPAKPSYDPRVRRAMHLALDKHVLVEVVKDVTPTLVGGLIYPFSEWATPPEEMSKRLGYQTDQKAAVLEARRLLAEAEHGEGIKGAAELIEVAQSGV